MLVALLLLASWLHTCTARPEVHMVVFGCCGPQYTGEAYSFKTYAESTGKFDHVHAFYELPPDVATDPRWQPHLQNGRGYGYWFWKSVLSKKVMAENMSYGDVLVYEDGGGVSHGVECCPAYANWDEWGNLLEQLCDHEIIATEMYYPEWAWTKGDTRARFNVSYDVAPYNWGQVAATSFMARKTPRTEKFFSLWTELASDFQLISDQPSNSPNWYGFRENRHDQSLFSMLLKSSNPQVDGLPEQDYELNKEFGIQGLRPFLLRGYPSKSPQHDEYRFRSSGSNRLMNCVPASCHEDAARYLDECTATSTMTSTSTSITSTTTSTNLFEIRNLVAKVETEVAGPPWMLHGWSLAPAAVIVVVLGATVTYRRSRALAAGGQARIIEGADAMLNIEGADATLCDKE